MKICTNIGDEIQGWSSALKVVMKFSANVGDETQC